MTFYDEAAAVPLIVSWKGRTPAGRVDREHLVSALDVLPTICDYAGVQAPPMMRGHSLREVIENPDRPGHEFVVAEMTRGGAGGVRRSFMVRTAKYKYMVFPGSGGERIEMLFDLQSDPAEITNLVSRPALAGELDRHRRLLSEWNGTTEEDKHPPRPGPEKPRRKANR
jgi:arylsulfatase A-like enzyme